MQFYRKSEKFKTGINTAQCAHRTLACHARSPLQVEFKIIIKYINPISSEA